MALMPKTYDPTPQTLEQIKRVFLTNARPLTPDQVARIDSGYHLAGIFGRALALRCPPGRELALALTNLEQAMLWAEQAIRGEAPLDVVPAADVL